MITRMRILMSSLSICTLALGNLSAANLGPERNVLRAEKTLEAIYSNYSVPQKTLLRETYPFDESYTATYLADEEKASKSNDYSYLWPYSGTFTAVNSLYESTKNKKYLKMLEKQVLPGLEQYWDCKRIPCAYASYVNTAPESDRFYDDNVWIGIDFVDAYMLTRKKEYLNKSKEVWKFIESGTDDILGGGIYWCEQKKESKNTCSNAPGAVYALKLFAATNDSSYFYKGKALYEWTKKNLQDSSDFLYYDNKGLDGHIGKAKYAYNSGQMMQAAALLYHITNNNDYLVDAQIVAKACYDYFFVDHETESGFKIKLLKKGNIWFTAVMLRGFIELYDIDHNREYLETFQKNLDFAWYNGRDENGLFNVDWTREKIDKSKWLLTQAAMVEMYARLGAVKYILNT